MSFYSNTYRIGKTAYLSASHDNYIKIFKFFLPNPKNKPRIYKSIAVFETRKKYCYLLVEIAQIYLRAHSLFEGRKDFSFTNLVEETGKKLLFCDDFSCDLALKQQGLFSVTFT